MSDVTQILGQIEDGDGRAAEELLPLIYDELRKLAAAKIAQNEFDTIVAGGCADPPYSHRVSPRFCCHLGFFPFLALVENNSCGVFEVST